MEPMIAIRKEDKSIYEKRTPLIPKHIKQLSESFGVTTCVQQSAVRVYSDGEYKEAGASIYTENTNCPANVIFGVKEIPMEQLQKGRTYVFFSHVIKGQSYNMPMLKKMKKLGCNLIDYEKITDSEGKRLIYFSKHAGYAGMINTIWALGERWKALGIETPFYEMRQAYKYRDLNAAKDDLKLIADLLTTKGVPKNLAPIVIGIAGYGNVSKGCQRILEMLPTIEIKPSELETLKSRPDISANHIYKVVFKEKDMVTPKDKDVKFDLQDYYNHPAKYKSVFDKYLPYMTVFVNAIFWSDKYPRFVTREATNQMWKKGKTKLQVIGDISCDINGGVEMTTKCTDTGNPVYVFDPHSGNSVDGFVGNGFVIMAVDNLPCEIPKESSDHFSSSLYEFVPAIASCDFTKDFNELELPQEVKEALIVHNGKLTEKYNYLRKYLTHA